MLEFRAVGNRCAVHFPSLKLPISAQRALLLLIKKGFEPVEVDLVVLARSCCGVSAYRRGADPDEAPRVMDCSTFTQWLYGQRGIELERRSIQQLAMGAKVRARDIQSGDLLFTPGIVNYYEEDPALGVGHVGLATGENTVIHAANRLSGIVESQLANFVGNDPLYVRRIIPSNARVLTLLTPPARKVKSSDDIRWILLQSL